jgi:enoyl-[acyl-carrier protein] reductase III
MDMGSVSMSAHFFNMNAADPEKMNGALDEMAGIHMGEGEDIGVLMHSLAFGTLRAYVGEDR